MGIMIVLLMTMCSAHRTKHHKRVQFNLNKAGLGSKEVTVTTNIIKKTKAFLDKQVLDSEPANALHKEAPAGRWTDDKALLSSGQLSIRVVQKGVEDDNMSVFAKLQYKLSDDMLFFLTQDDDYRGIQYGMNLIDIPIKSDKLVIGDCCARIEPKVKHVEIELYSFTGYCFRIDMSQQNWLLCDEDMPTLNTFRDLLVRATVAAWYRVNMPGLNPPTGIDATRCAEIPFTWAAGSQKMWPCRCAKKKSTQQSPLAIEESVAVPQDDTVLNINLGNSYSIRYGIVIREPEFFGDFGSFDYVTPKGKEQYNIFKFSFKIGGAEHPITKGGAEIEKIVAEMHIHGKDQTGKYGILAIQFTSGSENPFLKAININKWDYTKSWST